MAMDDYGEGGVTDEIVDKYVAASRTQQEWLRGVQMDVDIAAELPKMKKTGRLHALRQISKIGRITYDAIRFEGDNTIKKEVIARYLSAETEADKGSAPPITPEFYKFKYRGQVEREGKQIHLFQVTPRKKRVGTFKGDLWLDKETCQPLREAGRMVKNPSVFVRQMEFVRTYEIRNGVAIPKHTTGTVDTRLWGKAEVNIDFSNFNRIGMDTETVADAEESGSGK